MGALLTKYWKFFLIATLGLGLLIVAGLIVWFSYAGWWPVVVDAVLAFTALVSLLLFAVLTAAVVYFILIVRQLKADLTPVLDSLRKTSNTVRATASTATSFGVKPAVRTASLMMGAGEVASVILRRGRARSRAEVRQRRRQEIEREMAEKGELDGHL